MAMYNHPNDYIPETMTEIIQIPTPKDFSYGATINSHGWLRLAPFSYEDGTAILTRVHRLDSGQPVLLHICDGLEVKVEGAKRLTDPQREQIVRDVRVMFSLDWDLSKFYKAIRKRSQYAWVEKEKAGRMLVTPTVWEDLAKTLMTTNTTWSQTKNMVTRLCSLGTQYAPDLYAFPTPQQIAQLSAETLSEKIRAGYRAAYLHELAKRISSGELNPEAWRDLPSVDLYKTIKGLLGFGDYAAGTMLRLLGHFDRLAIDTECRAAYKRINKSETATDAEIRAYYEGFGDWRGLVMWMDVMHE